ncbi:MAG TPA: DNA adenine methylase [Aliidongia sp.]|uniref:DNA adenine methylase n=1 Tax=Aliidongia sp. TaxID=1914230 RepID=UPI002DDCEB3C|nr:DNA adenine methylase [Aliidongia sp.]HEV2674243.1 DNA adenine methylase [Aliidongia sp.]
MSSVRVDPIAPYIGGKHKLAARITAIIEATPHDLYAEPFVGMGGIFLRRSRAAKVEIINDYSQDVATLFRILQRHFPQFLDVLKWQLTTRADFDRLAQVDPTTLTDLERAARFLYLQRTGFGGKVAGRNFGTSRTGPARFDLNKLVPLLEAVHERLASVVIERLPYEDFIRRYDREGALFYLDPPYYGSEADYSDTADLFSRLDFDRLALVLRTIRGRFLVSLNDHPGVRRAFDGFAFEEIETTYTIGGNGSAKRVGELMITKPQNMSS